MIAKLIGAVVAIGLSFGLNVVLRPEFDTHYDPAEYALQAGTITLVHRGGTLEIPLIAIHIVTRDVERLGRRYKIRELALRAVASGGGWPRMELFADLSQVGGDLLGGAHDPSVLVQTELPLALHGRLGARPSYVVLERTQRSAIVTGNLLITDITQTSNGDSPEYRAQGRIEFQVQTENGVSMVTGKWSGRVVWDATGT
jgi:hypothetical protein